MDVEDNEHDGNRVITIYMKISYLVIELFMSGGTSWSLDDLAIDNPVFDIR